MATGDTVPAPAPKSTEPTVPLLAPEPEGVLDLRSEELLEEARSEGVRTLRDPVVIGAIDEEELSQDPIEESRRLRRLSILNKINELRNRGNSVFRYDRQA